MSPINNFLWVILLLIFSVSRAQSNVKEKIFLTADSLATIHLLPNHQFGYISYKGSSPYNYKSTRSTRGSYCAARSYEVDERGSGTYKISKNKLFLNFETPKHPIDSISRKFLEDTNISDSISVEILIKPYIPHWYPSEMIGIGISVISSDGKIDLQTNYDSYTKFKIGNDQLPLNLAVGGYGIVIVEQQNQTI